MVPAYTFSLDSGQTVTPFTPFTRAIAEGKRLTLKPVHCTLDSIAFLQYTGGTTGLSKGAVLTHRNIVAAILQAKGGAAEFLDYLEISSCIHTKIAFEPSSFT